jgi:hypothetical protein
VHQPHGPEFVYFPQGIVPLRSDSAALLELQPRHQHRMVPECMDSESEDGASIGTFAIFADVRSAPIAKMIHIRLSPAQRTKTIVSGALGLSTPLMLRFTNALSGTHNVSRHLARPTIVYNIHHRLRELSSQF